MASEINEQFKSRGNVHELKNSYGRYAGLVGRMRHVAKTPNALSWKVLNLHF
jgi:hypothetical protein